MSAHMYNESKAKERRRRRRKILNIHIYECI